MPIVYKVEEGDPPGRVRTKLALRHIGPYCCSVALATWMFVSGVAGSYPLHPVPILGCFHALPIVLSFFFLLSPMKYPR